VADRPGLLREAIRLPLPLETFARARQQPRVVRCLGPAIE
jgi:hypothetical protein